MWRPVLVVAVLLAGCTAPGGVDAPPPGERAPDAGPLECPPLSSIGLAFPLHAAGDARPTDAAPGSVTRADALTPAEGPALAWTWQQVRPGEAADHLLRIGEWGLHRTGPDEYWLCGDVNLRAPAEPEAAREPATLKVVVEGEEPLPAGNYTIVVRWGFGQTGAEPVNGHSVARVTLPEGEELAERHA